MTRRLLATIVVAVAVAGPFAGTSSAAFCGRALDQIGGSLPYPANAVYWRVCGP
jgi:hypothetical protein